MIRLLAIDIDGTLLDSHGTVPEANRAALVSAAARGVAVALVTGRSYHFSRPIAQLLPIPLTLIVNNGAVVKNAAGASLMRHLLDVEVARTILDGTRAYEDSVAIVFDRPDERQIVFERMDWEHPNRRGYYEKNRPFIIETTPLASALVEDPIQVMFNGGVGPMRQLVAGLRALAVADRFSIAITEYEHRDFSMVDVNGAGCSKGATLARWAAERGFTRDEVMAVGDNLNDVEMLEFAGTPVVMGNAVAPLRSRGWRMTATHDEAGLATAIADLLLGA